MAMLNHTVIVQNQAPSGDGIVTHDLSVNPLSALLINLRPLLDTGTIASFPGYRAICEAINTLTIRHRGQSIVAARGRELAALAVMRHGYTPWRANPASTNNERVCVTLPVYLGRRLYDPRSCFPESRRGEFVLEMDLDIADTGYDALQYTVEAVELLGANPSEFERKVQLTQTFAATGINDIDLPIGRTLRGLMLFGTTAFAGATPAPTFGRLQLIADGIGVGYSSVDYETLVNMTGFRSSGEPGDHVHAENDTGGPTDEAAEEGRAWQEHAYIDLDPTGDDAFSIDSSKVSRLQLRSDAEAAEAVRVIPIEKMPISALS